MEIILARHGKPSALPTDPIPGYHIGAWVSRYNEAGITRTLAPPVQLQRLAASIGCVVASDLRRSIESAQWLASSREVHIEPALREAGLPDSIGTALRMPPGIWVVVARAAWWLDWCYSSETVRTAKYRAELATDQLCSLADQHGTVLVIGHGLLNRLIATQLSRRGWRGPRRIPTAYWAMATFVQTSPAG
jgi:broad specificity phosphatase PhoE